MGNDMPASSIDRHTCATCGKQYQRSAHLRRHESIHTQVARHHCVYCEKVFSRRDVCRKHMIQCPNKHEQETLPHLKRGQKPRACDACFHSKQSCDTSDPCERCASRRLTCTYRRLERPPPVTTDVSSTASSSLVSTSVGTPSNDTDRTKIAVAFLLGVTNPASDSILEFLASEAAARTEGDGLDSSMKPAFPQNSSSVLADEDFTFLPYGFASSVFPELIEFQSMETFLPNLPPSAAVSPFNTETWKARADEIVSDMHDLHDSLIATDPWYDGSFDVNTAKSVLSADNLCAFSATHFRVSHLDFPIVHRPEFGTERTHKLLLLAVALSGSIRSPPSDNVLAARGFLDLAEEYIFRSWGRLMPPGSAPEFTREVQETLQAALLIHWIQFFKNDVASRRKNRTQRLPVLVSAVRCLGLAQTRHVAAMFEYEDFVLNKAKIRLATWTALADWQQSCMFNCPPTLTPAELTCDLPSPLELWNSKDKAEYFEEARALGIDGSRRISSVNLCIDALMRETWGGVGTFPFQGISGVDLHLLTFALNGMTLSANLMGTLPASAHALLRAISRCETMWESFRSRMGPASFEKCGMVRHNSELCWVSRKIVQVAISGDKSSAYMQKAGHDSLVQLHEFVRQYRDT